MKVFEEIKDGLFKINPEYRTKRVLLEVAKVSAPKFAKDAQKYGDWCVLPHCDICNEIYNHYYVTEKVWKESKLTGWVCLECLSNHLKRPLKKKDFVNVFGNLFEVETSAKELDRKIDTLARRRRNRCLQFTDILRVVYGITKSEYEDLKKIPIDEHLKGLKDLEEHSKDLYLACDHVINKKKEPFYPFAWDTGFYICEECKKKIEKISDEKEAMDEITKLFTTVCGLCLKNIGIEPVKIKNEQHEK